MLAEPAQALTDLALGAVTVALAVALGREAGAGRHWRTALWCFGAAALAGFVHHGVVAHWPRAADVSWAAISIVVVVAVSYLLAATVADVLGPGHAREFWVLRSIGLAAYVALAVTGHAGVGAILACESVTMLAILGLWGWAARHGHPRARAVLVAMVASGAAAATKALPEDLPLDPTSVYHLAQIPGMVLLFLALLPGPGHPAPPSLIVATGHDCGARGAGTVRATTDRERH